MITPVIHYTICILKYFIERPDGYGPKEQVYKKRNGGCGSPGRAKTRGGGLDGEISGGRTRNLDPAGFYLLRHNGSIEGGGIRRGGAAV